MRSVAGRRGVDEWRADGARSSAAGGTRAVAARRPGLGAGRGAPPVLRIAAGARQQQLLDSIGGAATVRAFRLGTEHRALAERRSAEAMGLTMRGVRLALRFYCRLHIAEFVGLTAVLGVGFLLVRDGSASIGTATAAALYFHALFGPMNNGPYAALGRAWSGSRGRADA